MGWGDWAFGGAAIGGPEGFVAGLGLGDQMGGVNVPEWGKRLYDPLGLFQPPPEVAFEGEMYQPGAAGGFGDMLLNAARGRGPSVAELQLQTGLDQSIKRGQALANSQRGVAPALAARMGTQMATAASMDANQAAAKLRAEEIARARQQYLGLEGMRGQQQMAYNQALLQKAMAEQQSKEKKEAGLVGAAGGLLAALCDRNAKDQIVPLDDAAVDEFVAAIQPSTYTYKDPAADGAREGPQVGVIAQDIAQTRIGRTIVKQTPEGMVIDVQGAVMALLGVVGNLGQRLKKE